MCLHYRAGIANSMVSKFPMSLHLVYSVFYACFAHLVFYAYGLYMCLYNIKANGHTKITTKLS